ncbi:MAG TPA: hypothetical protein VF478_05625, partial [Anaerolineae bacterium]
GRGGGSQMMGVFNDVGENTGAGETGRDCVDWTEGGGAGSQIIGLSFGNGVAVRGGGAGSQTRGAQQLVRFAPP